MAAEDDMQGAIGRGWWALYTRHQHEKNVASVLSGKGEETFLPLYESLRHWKDRSKKLWLPLFPGYVFIREAPERRLQVVSTPGIHMIVSRGDQFAVIADAEIESLRIALDGPSRVEPHPYLQSGERVRVIRGPLEGLQGILVRRKSLCRLVLSVEMLAQSACVEVNACDIEPIELRERHVREDGLSSKGGELAVAWTAGQSEIRL